jgi:Peptidase A4 family
MRKDAVSMTKLPQTGRITAAAVVVILTAGAFALAPASGARELSPGGPAPGPGRIEPGSPMAPAPGQAATAGPRSSTVTQVSSTNWGGYAAIRTGQPFRYVQATFFVPYVNCATTTDSFSAHWAGLDGFNTGTVEQTGVEADCQGGTPVYAAWWEMFPHFAIFPNIVVHPGDSIVASVFYQQRTRRFVLSLTDTSNGEHFTRVEACPSGSACQRASAEVISEPPADGQGNILPLSDFRAESFSGVRLTDQAGHRGTLRSARWNTVRITTRSAANGAVLDQPTQLFQGTTFDNYWMHSS